MMRVMSTSRITLFGIPNCDSVKKARVWMQDHQVDHDFHDFKKQGVPEAALATWLAAPAWPVMPMRNASAIGMTAIAPITFRPCFTPRL